MRTVLPDDTEFVSLAEVKQHLNITAARDDDEIAGVSTAAQELVESMVGPILHSEVTEVVTPRNGGALLRKMPVLAVTAATSTTSGDPLTATLDASVGRVVLSPIMYDTANVTYTVGRDLLPEPIHLATLIIAGHLWRTQRGNETGSIVPGADDELVTLGMGYSVPNRAMELLAPYLLAPAVA